MAKKKQVLKNTGNALSTTDVQAFIKKFKADVVKKREDYISFAKKFQKKK